MLDRRPLGTDVDLLAPIDPTVGQLAAHSRIAAKVWALQLTDLVLDGVGHREECPRRTQHVGHSVGADPVPDEVEETRVVGCLAQGPPEGLWVVFGRLEIENREHDPIVLRT